jgi:pyrophosphate--fructose-6-phosphate 1-phosphotransferase
MLTEGRRKYVPPLAPCLMDCKGSVFEQRGDHLTLIQGREMESPPLRIGVVFSGGPASGGANVVWGIFEALQELNPQSTLIGFHGGPSGILDKKYRELTRGEIDEKRNVGGFDLLGTGRTKIEGEEQFAKSLKVVEELGLNGLVFIGGDDTNTNAAHLSSYFSKNGSHCVVVGVPKTIDGDLQTDLIEISFGFDTACKVYSEMIGNICTDAQSSLKYWHFIKLMGRKASHVTLECALQTLPNVAFIGEEIESKKTTLSEITSFLADTIEKRGKAGKNYGVVLIPEGLIEFIPSIKTLIEELNRLVAKGKEVGQLTSGSKEIFNALPKGFQEQLLQDRDPHGNIQVSKIDTEALLGALVKEELKKRNSNVSLNIQNHFFGYEGRCSYPSNFDATYCYNLGFTAALLVRERKSGYMAGIRHLNRNVKNWEPIGAPIAKMLVDEERKGEVKKVIAKALVDLKGNAFGEFVKKREHARFEDAFRSPGPIQFCGEGSDDITKTLALR